MADAAGPWEDYGGPTAKPTPSRDEAGPWSDYGAAPPGGWKNSYEEAIGASPPVEYTPNGKNQGFVSGLEKTGGAVVGAGTSLAGLPGDLFELGNRVLPNFLTRPMGSPAGTAPLRGQGFPTSADLATKTDALGLTGRPEQAPASRLEGLELGAIKGGVMGAATGGLGASPLGAVAQGAAGGALGEAAHQQFPDSTWAPILAGIVGGAGMQKLGAVLGASPIEQVARTLGGSQTLEQAGNAVQTGARNWLANVKPQRLAGAFQEFDSQVPAIGNVLTPANNLTGALRGIVHDAGWAQPVVDQMKGLLPQRLYNAIQNQSIAGLGLHFSWDEMDQIRKRIGNAMGKPMANPNLSQQELSRMYAAITDDMESTLRRINPDLAQTWQDGNAAARQIYLDSGRMGKIVKAPRASADDPLPGRAAKSLLETGKVDASDLAMLQREMPVETGELAASHLRVGGHREWAQMTPEAKEALVPNPLARRRLDQIAGDEARKGGLPGHVIGGGFGGLIGQEAGHNIATLIGNALGSPEASFIPGAYGGLIGAGLGLGAPFAIQAGRRILRDPRTLIPSVLGGAAGNRPTGPR